MGKECLEKVMVLHGIIEEFANGFTIRKGKTLDLKNIMILHGSPEVPYETVKKFIHRKSEVVITERGHIIDILPITEKEPVLKDKFNLLRWLNFI